MNKKIVGPVGVLMLVTTACLLFYQANRNSPHMEEPRKEFSHTSPLPSSTLKCENKNFRENYEVEHSTSPFPLTVIRGCGDLVERIRRLNLALAEIRSKVSEQVQGADWEYIPTNSTSRIIRGQDFSFFRQLSQLPDVKTIFLDWHTFSNGSSKVDSSNLLVQNYYPLTASDPLCTWVETPGKTDGHYEVVYNYTCNRDYSKAVLPEGLNSLDLKDDLNSQTTRTSLEYTTYIHIIAYGLVSNNGEVFRSGLKIAPRGCLEPSDQPPGNANELELHGEVFVITQHWGTEVFHRMVEIIPRLVLYLDFLKRHPNVKIISPEGSGGRLEEILGILGLDKRRIRIGWCRAKIIYLPRPTRCGRANIQEVQVLSHHFRDYISKNFPFQNRNRVVLIRRSGSRRFTEQQEIEKVVESAAIDFNLSFAMFVDNPTPSFNDTMRLFKSAVMVVAPHGAGLSNILFSDPGTYVIEGVCNLPHLNLCFHRLARVLGHRWHGIPSRGGCEGVVNVSASAVQFTVRQYLVHHNRSRTNLL